MTKSRIIMPPRTKKPPALTLPDAVTTPDKTESLVVSESPPAEATEVGHRRTRRKIGHRSSDLVSAIPTAVFHRLVREIASDIKSDLRWEAEALEALQVDAEAYMIGRFGEANMKRDMCKSRTLKRAHFVVQ